MRGDGWKRAYVYEVDATSIRLQHEGLVVDTLKLDSLEQVALRFDVSVGMWQWLLVVFGDDTVRALPHDDALVGHAQLSAALRALPGFQHRSYAETLTSPSRRGEDARAQLLWTRGEASKRL